MSIKLLGLSPSDELRRFARWLDSEMEVDHRVNVHLTSELWGYFDAPGRYTGFDPYAVVELKRRPLLTMAHELVHYEQWRDKRPGNERGVEQRAAALVNRWRRER